MDSSYTVKLHIYDISGGMARQLSQVSSANKSMVSGIQALSSMEQSTSSAEESAMMFLPERRLANQLRSSSWERQRFPKKFSLIF
jgi:hypothetical protein